jgi:hypothetical protein
MVCVCVCVYIYIFLKEGPSSTAKCDAAMQEASLEDEAQDAGTAHLLLLPSWCTDETTSEQHSEAV